MLNTFEDFEKEASKYGQIIFNYKSKGEVYTDPNFHPTKNIPEVGISFDSYIKWKRIDEIYKAPLFKPDLIHPDYIQQGHLGNCYFVTPLLHLSTQPHLIPYLFDHKPNIYFGKEKDSINIKCGAVVVYLHAFGRKTPVLIDTLLPTICDTPLFSRLKDSSKSAWFCLVEKAYAKLYGSYSEIETGTIFQSVYSLLGYYSRNIETFVHSDNLNKLYEKLLRNKQKGSIMEAGINKDWTEDSSEENLKKKGLVGNHSYLILDVKQIDNKNFICLKNPWGRTEWKGDWSDESDLWTPELKEKVGLNVRDDGTFWMIDNDFFKYFDQISISKPIPPNLRRKVICCEMLSRDVLKSIPAEERPHVVIERKNGTKGKIIIITERRHTILDKEGKLNPKHDLYCASGIAMGIIIIYQPKVLCYYGKINSEKLEISFVRRDESSCSDDIYVSVYYDGDFDLYLKHKPDDLAPEIERVLNFDDFNLAKKEESNEKEQEEEENNSVNQSDVIKVEDQPSQKVKYYIRPLQKLPHKRFNLTKKHDIDQTEDGKKVLKKEGTEKKTKITNKESLKEDKSISFKSKSINKRKPIKNKNVKDQYNLLDEKALNATFKSIRDSVISSRYLDDKK